MADGGCQALLPLIHAPPLQDSLRVSHMQTGWVQDAEQREAVSIVQIFHQSKHYGIQVKSWSGSNPGVLRKTLVAHAPASAAVPVACAAERVRCPTARAVAKPGEAAPPRSADPWVHCTPQLYVRCGGKPAGRGGCASCAPWVSKQSTHTSSGSACMHAPCITEEQSSPAPHSAAAELRANGHLAGAHSAMVERHRFSCGQGGRGNNPEQGWQGCAH